MDIAHFHRENSGKASNNGHMVLDIVRAETIAVADDDQQFQITLLDADDSFDIMVTYPNGTTEIVWSLVRERTLEG
jgi:hypothetical protein